RVGALWRPDHPHAALAQGDPCGNSCAEGGGRLIMRPAAFDYVAPTTLSEACRELADRGPDARVIAGGQSLVPAMTLRVACPSALIDRRQLSELRSIVVRDGIVSIGALTTHAEIARSANMEGMLALLPEVAGHIAHAAIRNRGTIGGSLANADPA